MKPEGIYRTGLILTALISLAAMLAVTGCATTCPPGSPDPYYCPEYYYNDYYYVRPSYHYYWRWWDWEPDYYRPPRRVRSQSGYKPAPDPMPQPIPLSRPSPGPRPIYRPPTVVRSQ